MGVTVDDVCSWPTMIAALEDAEPWWEPGTAVGYHAYTFGYLAGEIVRRVTGRALGDVLADLTAEIGRPGEIRYGMRDAAGLAVLEDAPSDVDWSRMPAEMLRAAPLSVLPTAALGADPRMLAADIPAGAKVTARALAALYARWLASPRLAEVSTVSAAGEDRVYGNPCRMSLGFALGPPFGGDETRAFGWAGAGGSWAGADPDRGVAVAVTKNVLGMDFTHASSGSSVRASAVRSRRYRRSTVSRYGRRGLAFADRRRSCSPPLTSLSWARARQASRPPSPRLATARACSSSNAGPGRRPCRGPPACRSAPWS